MSLPHLLLGLLEQAPMSGYDLNKAFQESINHFWTTDRSQIYRTLHKLRDSGWLEIEHIVQSDNPDKKVYHLTESGRMELQRWLITPIETQPICEGWLGQIFFGEHAPPEATIRLLEAYRDEAQARLQALKAIYERYYLNGNAGSPEEIPPDWVKKMPSKRAEMRFLSLDYGLTITQAHIDWCNTTIEHFQQHIRRQSQSE